LKPAGITDERQSSPCKTVLAAPGPDVVATWVTPQDVVLLEVYSVAVGTTKRISLSIVFKSVALLAFEIRSYRLELMN